MKKKMISNVDYRVDESRFQGGFNPLVERVNTIRRGI